MSKFKQIIEQAKAESAKKEKALHAEPYQVEILLPSQPNIIRLTYKNINSQILTAIEELDINGNPLTYSTIKARKIEGNVPQLLIDMVPMFRIKPEQWVNNPEYFLEGYYKNH